MTTIKVTKEFIEDFRVVLQAVIKSMGNHVYNNSSAGSRLAIIDLERDKVLQKLSILSKKDNEKLDISKMWITNYMITLYDFAVNGRLEKSVIYGQHKVIDDNVSEYFRWIEKFPVKNGDYFPIHNIIKVIDLANARYLIDTLSEEEDEESSQTDISPKYLHIKDVALLAGIDEKTARNLASPKSKNRLVTTNLQGRTLVELNFAKEWLKHRGYKPTVKYEEYFERTVKSFSEDGFNDFYELSMYVEYHAKKKGLTIIELATCCGVVGIDEKSEHAYGDLMKHINYEDGFDSYIKIAEKLNLDIYDFVVLAHKTRKNSMDLFFDFYLQDNLEVLKPNLKFEFKGKNKFTNLPF